MTRAELQSALEQQQAENAALRAELARARQLPLSLLAGLPPEQQLVVQLMQQLYAAVVLTDPAGRIIWVNAGFTELCGLEPAAVLGRPARAVTRFILTKNQVKYLDGRLAARRPFDYEVQNPRPAAGWVRMRVQPVSNAQGEIVLMAAMLEDITAGKEAQLSRDESERRFQALAENVPGVLYQWRKNFDDSFEFGYVSPKLEELFGIRVEDIGRMPEFIHPEDLPAFRHALRQAVEQQAPWAFEGRLLVPGQPLRWMQGNSGVTGTDERGIKYSGILQDVTPVKCAQQVLRERDIRLRLAVEGFRDGAWELNVQSRAIYFSPDYKAMLGYRAEEFPDEYDSWLTHVHPDDLAIVRETVASYLSGSAPFGVAEYRLRCKDGAYKWVLSRAVLTARDAADQPLILSGLQTDITELKRAKEALEDTTRRLATVVSNLQEGLVLEDESRRIMLTNQTFCNLLSGDFTPASLMGKSGHWLAEKSLAFVRNPVQYQARITALLRRRQVAVGDVVQLHDGRTLRRDFTPVYDQERYIGQLWKFEDITARTRVQNDLRRREEKYRGIIENMSLGLVEADLNDHLLYANQSFCNMTGYCDNELSGRRLSPLLLTGEDLALVESKLETRQQGVADSYEIAVTTKSGELKWMLVSGAPLYDDHQQLIGSIGIYLDVTPHKRLEASLREAKAAAEVSIRVKQDFLANMSHEIRTPMNAILGMSRLLAKTPLVAPQDSYLHAIEASAEHLLVIINDILDLSKMEAGHLAVEHISFSPAQLFAQVEKTMRYKAEAKGLDFTTHLGPGVPEVLLGDPYRLTQILLNLAGNSIKFTERGAVTIACALLPSPAGNPRAEVLAEFIVGDTGIGMDESYLARMFESFSQEDASVSRKFGGTGLGLGISKKLVELLGGELRISSQKNWGTTSRFTLPLPVGAVQDLVRPDHTLDLNNLRPRLHGKRVLLVEDNTFNRMLANVFLNNFGLHVTEAINGELAVELARTKSFDLLLMDVQMPVMDGYEATAIIRQELGVDVPIIALTANAISGEREKCLTVGMNDYLTKPFEEATLIKMVYDWVA